MVHINRGKAWSSARRFSIDEGIDRDFGCSSGSRLGGGSSHINTFRILGSTGVVYSAIILARGVTIAFEDALVVGLRAGVVGNSLGIFGAIRGGTVAAQAVVE